MRVQILVILLLFGVADAFSQAKPIYFGDKGVSSDPKNATAYGVYGKLSGQQLWVLKKYDFNDNLMLTGSFKDELMEIAHGKFIFYSSVSEFNDQNSTYFNTRNIDRFVSSEGELIDGFDEGRWNFYFPDGSTSSYLTYVKGKLNGTTKSFSPKGETIFSGQYEEGRKVGYWYDLKKKRKVHFENGNLINTVKMTKAEIADFK